MILIRYAIEYIEHLQRPAELTQKVRSGPGIRVGTIKWHQVWNYLNDALQTSLCCACASQLKAPLCRRKNQCPIIFWSKKKATDFALQICTEISPSKWVNCQASASKHRRGQLGPGFQGLGSESSVEATLVWGLRLVGAWVLYGFVVFPGGKPLESKSRRHIISTYQLFDVCQYIYISSCTNHATGSQLQLVRTLSSLPERWKSCTRRSHRNTSRFQGGSVRPLSP